MSSDRTPRLSRRAALLGLVGVAGCGFAPVYGSGGTASALRNTVRVTAPRSVDGFRFGQALEGQLGRATSPSYDLTVTLDIGSAPVAIASDNSATRITLPGKATYVLTGPDGAAVATGSVDAFTGYSATGSTVATRAAETDARERLVVILADMIVTRLIAATAA